MRISFWLMSESAGEWRWLLDSGSPGFSAFWPRPNGPVSSSESSHSSRILQERAGFWISAELAAKVLADLDEV